MMDENLFDFDNEAWEEDAEEDTIDFWGELKRAAWNITREHPGIECQEWMERLIEEYPNEVVDALGTNPFDVFPLLTDTWDCNDYEDPETGECLSFRDWSEYFANDPESLRENLERANERIRELETEVALLKAKTQNEAHRAEK